MPLLEAHKIPGTITICNARLVPPTENSEPLLRESMNRWRNAEQQVSHLQRQLKRVEADNTRLRSKLSDDAHYPSRPDIEDRFGDCYESEPPVVTGDGPHDLIRLVKNLTRLVNADGVESDDVECDVRKSMLDAALSLDDCRDDVSESGSIPLDCHECAERGRVSVDVQDGGERNLFVVGGEDSYFRLDASDDIANRKYVVLTDEAMDTVHICMTSEAIEKIKQVLYRQDSSIGDIEGDGKDLAAIDISSVVKAANVLLSERDEFIREVLKLQELSHRNTTSTTTSSRKSI